MTFTVKFKAIKVKQPVVIAIIVKPKITAITTIIATIKTKSTIIIIIAIIIIIITITIINKTIIIIIK